MTPEEAERFREDDEDPAKVFAAYDAGPHGVTVAPGFDPAGEVRRCRAWIRERYGPRAEAP